MCQQRRPFKNPVTLRLVRGQQHRNHKIGAMPCGGQNSSPYRRFIQRCDVSFVVLGHDRLREHPNSGHKRVDFSGFSINEFVHPRVPSPSVQENPVDDRTVLWRRQSSVNTTILKELVSLFLHPVALYLAFQFVVSLFHDFLLKQNLLYLEVEFELVDREVVLPGVGLQSPG